MQVSCFDEQLQAIIELPLCYTEETYELTLCHGDSTFAFANDLHIVAPLEIAALSFCLMVIDIHTASSFISSF